MTVVSNTTPIITFSCVNKIDMLKHSFKKIYILVLDEMIINGRWISKKVYLEVLKRCNEI